MVLWASARLDKEDTTVGKIKENVGLLDAYLRAGVYHVRPGNAS